MSKTTKIVMWVLFTFANWLACELGIEAEFAAFWGANGGLVTETIGNVVEFYVGK